LKKKFEIKFSEVFTIKTKGETMISNRANTKIIHELIDQLRQQGLDDLNDLLSGLFNK
jgi:hypothetical protein